MRRILLTMAVMVLAGAAHAAEEFLTAKEKAQLKPAEGWGWVVFSGAISMLLAIMLWRGWPATGAVAIGLLVGIRLVFTVWSIAMLGAVSDSVGDAIEMEAAAESGESKSVG